MVTLIKYGALSGGEKYNVNALSLDGLSTDTKPTRTYIEYGSDGREVGRMGIPNGSLYTEIDTGDTYMYDVDNTTWHKVSIGGGGGGGFTPTPAQLTAMNSGIDSEKVEQIETNKNNILSKANISDVNTATANLQAQIDEIVTPVTQDAEVQNARVGYDGTSYTTLKERLDTEAEGAIADNALGRYETTSKFKKLNRLNLEYPNGFTFKGYYNGSGNWYADSNCLTTDYIDIRGCDSVSATGLINNTAYGVCVFDEDKNIIRSLSVKGSTSRIGKVEVSFDTYDPDYVKVAYIRVSVYSVGASKDGCGVELITDETWIEKEFKKDRTISSKRKVIYPDDFTFKGYVNTSSGSWTADSRCLTTDYIDVKDSPYVYAAGKINRAGYAIALYNSSKVLLRSLSITNDVSSPAVISHTFDMTDPDYSSVKYMRVSVYGQNSNCGAEYTVNETSSLSDVNGSIALKTANVNLINPAEIKDGGCYLYDTGIWNSGSGYSDYSACICEVKENTNYNVSRPSSYIVFYDENMNYIGGHGYGGDTEHEQLHSNPVLTPNGCKYLASHVLTSAKSYMYVSEFVEQYYPYGKKVSIVDDDIADDFKPVLRNTISPLKGKIINAFGDSITSTDYIRPNWWEQIAARTGATFNDYGYSGDTLAHTDSRHLWAQHFQKDDPEEIGYNPDDPTTWETGNCFCERIDRTDASADGIIIMGGTNDGGVPLGTWDSTDTATFYGGLNVLLTKAINRFPGKPILICTPIQGKSSYESNVADPLSALLAKSAADLLSVQLRAEAIKAKCRQYGLPCLDLFNESGINGADSSGVYYIADDIWHPSAVGQYRLSTLIQSALEKLYR